MIVVEPSKFSEIIDKVMRKIDEVKPYLIILYGKQIPKYAVITVALIDTKRGIKEVTQIKEFNGLEQLFASDVFATLNFNISGKLSYEKIEDVATMKEHKVVFRRIK